MKAEIIAVGTELLMGEILNSNSRDIARELYNLGIDVYHQSVVGDNLNRVSKELETAFERADLVITTGGLGPTRDDLTKEAAASTLGPMEPAGNWPSARYLSQSATVILDRRSSFSFL